MLNVGKMVVNIPSQQTGKNNRQVRKIGKYSYLLTFIEGILTFISPCILPMIPIYFFYMAGITGKDDDKARYGTEYRNRLIMNSLAFVIGFTLVFVALGAAATAIGHFLKDNIDLFRKIGGIVIIIFGLNFLGLFKLNFLNTEKRFNYSFKQLKFFNSIIFGAVFGFGWTPCLGPFLGTALITAGNSETLLQGIILLLLYSAGLGIPFVVTAILFEKLKDVLYKVQNHSRIISIISGIVLILAGILVFTDSLKYLTAFLQ